MFLVSKDKLGSLDVYQLTNTISGEYISLIPQKGGLLYDIGVQSKDGVVSIIDKYETQEELNNMYHINFKGAKLAPYPNRIAEGSYTSNSVQYSFPIDEAFNGFSIHGFVLEKEFSVESVIEDAEKAELILKYIHVNSEGFPFSFDLELRYTLTENSIDIATVIKNTGTQTMPYGDGWHPYFICGDSLKNLSLTMPTELHYFTENMLPNGWFEEFNLFNKAQSLSDLEFDDSFLLQTDQSKAVIQLQSLQNNFSISIWVDTNSYPYVHLYTPKDRKSLAIEPMSCLPNAFNNEIGLKKVKKGESCSFYWGLLLK